MALSFSQTLIRVSSSSSVHACNSITKTCKLSSAPTLKPVPNALTFRLLSHRNHSDYSDLTHVDSPSSDELIEALTVQKLEDAIHSIRVTRCAPDWLPFFPGSSYWVPSRRSSHALAKIAHKLANSLTEEQVMSLTTVGCWPSSTFYIPEPSSKTNEVETSFTLLDQDHLAGPSSKTNEVETSFTQLDQAEDEEE